MLNIYQKSPEEILNAFGLRQTSCRKDVLDEFLRSRFALSQGYLESHIDHSHDRVTIYRNLKTFLEKGILHKVLDDEGVVKYALCKDDCSPSVHDHGHVHFKCEKCGRTVCMDQVHIPGISIPAEFEVTEINLLVQGICDQCS